MLQYSMKGALIQEKILSGHPLARERQLVVQIHELLYSSEEVEVECILCSRRPLTPAIPERRKE